MRSLLMLQTVNLQIRFQNKLSSRVLFTCEIKEALELPSSPRCFLFLKFRVHGLFIWPAEQLPSKHITNIQALSIPLFVY